MWIFAKKERLRRKVGTLLTEGHGGAEGLEIYREKKKTPKVMVVATLIINHSKTKHYHEQ